MLKKSLVHPSSCSREPNLKCKSFCKEIFSSPSFLVQENLILNVNLFVKKSLVLEQEEGELKISLQKDLHLRLGSLEQEKRVN